ncbi:MAG TPA: glycosyltransferase [Patescibacteria group bacterium]|nr:glycosyltransferase [Patescibacteria group bacterium]
MVNRNNKPTLTIGIPAYNEEGNIEKIIKSLFLQKEYNFELQKILVVSDSSTDNTNTILKTIKHTKFEYMIMNKRSGQPNVQNEIIKKSNSDLLLLLNADVLLPDKYFLENLISEIKLFDKDNVGIVSVETVSATPKSFFERVIVDGREFKKFAYKTWKQGNNIYMCHGRGRLFFRRFYKNFVWDDKYPEDAYSYLKCLKKGFLFKFIKKPKIIFRSPSVFQDYKKQSDRYYEGKKKLLKIYNKNLIEKEYKVPVLIWVYAFLKNIITHPLFLGYILIYIYNFFNKKYSNRRYSIWDFSLSSKKI